MATTQITLGYPSGTKIFQETDLEGTAIAVASGAATVYQVEVDNALNTVASFVKLWNAASGSVTVGTTAPDWCLMVPASVKRSLSMVDGVAFGTALTAACVTTAGTAGTTNPTSSVIVKIVYA